MTFPFVSRSLYDSRIAGFQELAEKYRTDLADAYARIINLNQAIGSLTNRVANLNNSYDNVSNQLSTAHTRLNDLRNALAESDTIVTRLTAENEKLKCLKTSLKRKKSA